MTGSLIRPWQTYFVSITKRVKPLVTSKNGSIPCSALFQSPLSNSIFKSLFFFHNAMKFGVVNKSTTVNRFVLHNLQRNITHLAIITRNTNIKLGILKKKGGLEKRLSFPHPLVKLQNKAVQKLFTRNFSCKKCCNVLRRFDAVDNTKIILSRLSNNEFQKNQREGGNGKESNN